MLENLYHSLSNLYREFGRTENYWLGLTINLATIALGLGWLNLFEGMVSWPGLLLVGAGFAGIVKWVINA